MASMRRIFIDSLSVPTVIGIGPIKTTPPPFAFPFVLVEENAGRKVARRTIMNPMMTNVKPTMLTDVQSTNLFAKINTKK